MGPLETVSLNLGPGGASVQHLLTLREEVTRRRMLHSDSLNGKYSFYIELNKLNQEMLYNKLWLMFIFNPDLKPNKTNLGLF